jgi:SAM-dependent methyltransferase
MTIKLNLGCGKHLLQGWINVDAVAREGLKTEYTPDVTADVRALPFADDYADEAMAIHVIEHFYVWEVPDLLKEWRRVLKPGGRLVLECPDLTRVLAHLVSRLAGFEVPDRFTMWPLYGDPSYRDPLMCHKWAWTPATLAAEMQRAGFIGIAEAPAEFHMKAARDLRLIGSKPA